MSDIDTHTLLATTNTHTLQFPSQISVNPEFFVTGPVPSHTYSESKTDITAEESDALEIMRGGLSQADVVQHDTDATTGGSNLSASDIELPINTSYLTELIFDAFFEVDLEEDCSLMRDTVSALIFHCVGEQLVEVIGCFGKLVKKRVMEKKALELMQKTELLPKEKIPQNILDSAAAWHKEAFSRLHQTRSGSRLYHFLKIKHYRGEDTPPVIHHLAQLLNKQPEDLITSEEQMPLLLRKLKRNRDESAAHRQANRIKKESPIGTKRRLSEQGGRYAKKKEEMTMFNQRTNSPTIPFPIQVNDDGATYNLLLYIPFLVNDSLKVGATLNSIKIFGKCELPAEGMTRGTVLYSTLTDGEFDHELTFPTPLDKQSLKKEQVREYYWQITVAKIGEDTFYV